MRAATLALMHPVAGATNSPTTIFGANLKGWWVADDLSGSNGTSVASWSDRTASRALAEAGATTKPTLQNSVVNGHKIVRFDGTDDRLGYGTSGFLTSSGLTVWVVAKVANPSNNPRLVSATPFAGGDDWDQSTAFLLGFENTHGAIDAGDSGNGFKSSEGSTTPSTTAFHTFVGVRSASALRFYLDNVGATAAVGTWSALGVDQISIGLQPTFGSNYLSGDIAEIGIAATTADASMLSNLASYIASTYGI
jgi:hypothetical protein